MYDTTTCAYRVDRSVKEEERSIIIYDPSGRIYSNHAGKLAEKGYCIKCLDLINTDKSNRYNPFHYIRSDMDAEVLTMALMNLTKPPALVDDPFYDKSERLLLSALIVYLRDHAVTEEKNMAGILHLLQQPETEDDTLTSVSRLFERVAEKEPGSITCRMYETFKICAGRTAASVMCSCYLRLKPFGKKEIASLTKTDDIEIDRMFTEKMALFIFCPPGSRELEMLVKILYSQIFAMASADPDLTRDRSAWRLSPDEYFTNKNKKGYRWPSHTTTSS